MEIKEKTPHKPTVEYLTTYMHNNFVTKQEFHNKLDEVENRLNQRIDNLDNRITGIENRIDNLESEMSDIKTSTNKILDILLSNGVK